VTFGDDDLRAIEARDEQLAQVVAEMPDRVKLGWCGMMPMLCEFSTGTEYVRADLVLPRPWSTVEDLDALPSGSFLLVQRKTGMRRIQAVQKVSQSQWRGAGLEITSLGLAAAWTGMIVYLPRWSR
jgi:hypothetical protein